MKVKYVVFDEMYPVLLSALNQHAEVRLCPQCDKGEPTSAGFCSFEWSVEKCGFVVDVWGESISLGKKSNPADARCIATLLNGMGL